MRSGKRKWMKNQESKGEQNNVNNQKGNDYEE